MGLLLYGVCAENTCVYVHACTVYVCVCLYKWEGQLDNESSFIGEGMREREEGGKEREREKERKRERDRDRERERDRERGVGVDC